MDGDYPFKEFCSKEKWDPISVDSMSICQSIVDRKMMNKKQT